ncbi:MAG: L-serine ammonia-lyase, iron-sulfur-dependent, subunit beta [Bacteroidia bacterium]|nr:L-serine ammonia-lyase, iron-sulfur-dependent, subunit beta [Bacteroidia bacterium]
MSDRSSIFDMIGPIMIGPSSSHTAGVVRIGRVARRILGQIPQKVTITFYNSFARTFEGHGSDRAIMAGLLDFKTDDDRIREALEIAKQKGIEYVFRSVSNASHLHPNTIKVEATGENRKVEVLGISRGGGLISITGIDGFKCNFTAQQHTLVIDAHDVKGSIAFVTNIVANDGCNIATMTVDRSARNQNAKWVIEMDSGIESITLQYLQHLKWVIHVEYIPNIDL